MEIDSWSPPLVRRGLLLFFGLWYVIVVATNTTDLARVFGILGAEFPWYSDNYALLAGPAGASPALTVVFALGMLWELTIAVAFFRAFATDARPAARTASRCPSWSA